MVERLLRGIEAQLDLKRELETLRASRAAFGDDFIVFPESLAAHGAVLLVSFEPSQHVHRAPGHAHWAFLARAAALSYANAALYLGSGPLHGDLHDGNFGWRDGQLVVYDLGAAVPPAPEHLRFTLAFCAEEYEAAYAALGVDRAAVWGRAVRDARTQGAAPEDAAKRATVNCLLSGETFPADAMSLIICFCHVRRLQQKLGLVLSSEACAKLSDRPHRTRTMEILQACAVAAPAFASDAMSRAFAALLQHEAVGQRIRDADTSDLSFFADAFPLWAEPLRRARTATNP